MLKKYCFVIVTISFFVGCGFSNAKPEAEKLWSQYFNLIQSESYHKVLSLYSDAFFEQTSKEEWVTTLERVQGKLGTPQSYQLVNWNIKAQSHTSRTGTFITLVYQVKYSLHEARETMILFKPASGEQASIFGHHIVSEGLLQ